MKMEIRNNQLTISGYVNVTNRDSRVLASPRGRFVEQVRDGVFRRALEKADNVDVLFNHKEDRKLGSITDGNLKLHEDSVGLRAFATITDPEVIALAKKNELQGWSFGFIANNDQWSESDRPQRRYVNDMELLEVSILSVTPAYSGTSIESRGEDQDAIKEIRGFEFDSEIVNHDIEDEKRMLAELDAREQKLLAELEKFEQRKGVK